MSWDSDVELDKWKNRKFEYLACVPMLPFNGAKMWLEVDEREAKILKKMKIVVLCSSNGNFSSRYLPQNIRYSQDTIESYSLYKEFV